MTTIAKKTELNRTSCYDILDALMQRGIISKFKKSTPPITMLATHGA